MLLLNFPPTVLEFAQISPGEDPDEFAAAAKTVQHKVDHGGRKPPSPLLRTTRHNVSPIRSMFEGASSMP